MSILTQPGAKPETGGGTQPQTAAATTPGDAMFPRPRPDPQDDWPRDVRLPDELEDDEC